MRRPHKATPRVPRIGEFIVRPAYDARCRDLVVLKTGERYDDFERYIACERRNGAEKLAALMNGARELMREWHDVAEFAPLLNSDAKSWVQHVIVSAVARAIDGPRPEPFGLAAVMAANHPPQSERDLDATLDAVAAEMSAP